ncbi:MAG: nucleotidyl transferase AbiEii/AbiGii toxin family protein [Candidatus Tectomicrobia bacterium]|uniref:Nucleotidyl transferase AbiEii/AbiGii toxin family protein n=1 Tax=Tectimicrobiota bacterium TaxID=2528274 RepID=A0A932FX35_UNCTE|nr:nucleotidyl transferase AbiEii/AbiGii toxin family protein [Candidatus Tectomicrobia bacterium]
MSSPDAPREEARPPTIEDLLKLCQRLSQEQVKYVLIGGFAMIYHGMPRATEDIDLLVDPSSENVEKIKKALSFLPDKAILEINSTDIDKYQVVRIVDEFVIDLIKAACEIDYEQAVCERFLWRGVEVIIADVETMIKTKQSVRPKDKEDLAFLQQLKKIEG